MIEEPLIDTIGTIYEAGLEHDRWGDVLESVVEFVGGQTGVLGMSDVALSQARAFHSYRLDPDLLRRWYDEFDGEDPWIDYGSALVEGDVFAGFQNTTYEALRKRRVYREIMEPLGCRDVLGSIVAKNRLRLGWVNAYDAERENGFASESIEKMVHLTPHLHRATRIHAQFADLRAREEGARALIDALSFAVIACNERGGIVTANRAAEELLTAGDSIKVARGQIVCTDNADTKRLAQLLRQSAETAASRGALGGGALLLPRDGGARTLTLLVMPLSERREQGATFAADQSAVSLILITDPEANITAPEGVLRELFGLTDTETRLAVALANGDSLDEYAARAHVKRETARWHLKRVLSKTQTGRQSGLVSLLFRVLGPTSRRSG